MASVVGARALLQRASASGPGTCQARARAQVHTSTQARWRERRPAGGGHDDGSAHAISAPPSSFFPFVSVTPNNFAATRRTDKRLRIIRVD